MKKITVTVDDLLVNEIQAAQVEVEAKQNIITTILSSPGVEINTNIFNQYQKEYENAFKHYAEVKNKLESQYMPEEFKTLECMIDWNLDFKTHIVTFSSRD